MADTKLVLKYGEIEVHCEGSEEFIKKELPKLIEGIANLRRETGGGGGGGGAGSFENAGKPIGKADAAAAGKMSISTVAQKLGVKKGPELVKAAALFLSLQGSESFSKKVLRDTCRDATTFWRESYANNFDNYVARLVKKGLLNHTGGTNYAMPLDQKAALVARLK